MTEHPIHRLDDDVHQRVRLGVLACLAGVTRADFAFLRAELGVTDGNLGRHLAVLDAAGLVSMSKSSGAGRGRTWVKISRAGREALRKEIEALRQILTSIAPDPADDQGNDAPERTAANLT